MTQRHVTMGMATYLMGEMAIAQMLTVTCNEIEEAVQAERERILNSLNETFGTEFRLVTCTKPGDWRYLAADELIACGCSEVEGNIAASCEQIVVSQHPAIFASPNKPDTIVVVPVPKTLGSARAAVAHVVGMQPDVMQRLARLWTTSTFNEQVIESLKSDCENLTEQLVEGLEESSFIRSMFSCLDLANKPSDISTLAEEIMPQINEIVHSECSALLLTPEGLNPLESSPIVCVGPKQLSDELLLRIVECFGEAAKSKPVVTNNLNLTPEATKWPGVRDFILVPMQTTSRQLGWIVAVNRCKRHNLSGHSWQLSQMEFGTPEASLLSFLAIVLATYVSNAELLQEKEELLVNVVRALTSALDAKDEYTCGHSERVALYAKALAEQAGYNGEACERIYMSGLLHDIGKIGVSDAVLKKPGKLTDAEFDEIKRHPDEGWSILQDLDQLKYVLPGVLHHHEQVDGGGYPDRLAGEEIPMDGRILAIVDSFDAMTSDRPYRDGMPIEKAKQILSEGAGSQWDADLVQKFLEALDKIELIRKNYRLREKPVRENSENQAICR